MIDAMTTRRSTFHVVIAFLLLAGLACSADRFGVVAIAQTRAEVRPFEMLVLGDSVVWGQGLTEEKKFYTKVKNAIEQQLPGNRKVRQLVEAHSGAVIAPKKPKSCPVAPGEVPIGTPTLFSQVDAALTTYASFGVAAEDVDLVLLNGCINDVGFPAIVNPFTSDKTISKHSAKFCNQGMEKLLRHVKQTFPRAVIVVTGFFPIVSTATDRELVSKLLQAFFGQSKSAKILSKAEKEQQKELRQAAKRHQMLPNQPDWLIRRLAQLSDRWKTASDADLQAAVNAVNTDPTAPRAYLAKVDFQPEDCYAAGERTSLWRITGSGGGVGNLITDDEMFDQRQKTCRLAAAELNGFGKLICPAAGTGHPNLKGAQKYADAIIQKLRETPVLGGR